MFKKIMKKITRKKAIRETLLYFYTIVSTQVMMANYIPNQHVDHFFRRTITEFFDVVTPELALYTDSKKIFNVVNNPDLPIRKKWESRMNELIGLVEKNINKTPIKTKKDDYFT